MAHPCHARRLMIGRVYVATPSGTNPPSHTCGVGTVVASTISAVSVANSGDLVGRQRIVHDEDVVDQTVEKLAPTAGAGADTNRSEPLTQGGASLPHHVQRVRGG